jgi:hypothetical protein
LKVKGCQGNNHYLGGLDNFLEVVGPQKLLSLAVATFSWPFSKLNLIIVSFATGLQGNHL